MNKETKQKDKAQHLFFFTLRMHQKWIQTITKRIRLMIRPKI